jgi:D-inositol-3-phosphate glycosyltransferase
MRRLRERLAGLRWRLRATRRLWRASASPEMPFLPPGPLSAARGSVDEPRPGAAIGDSLYVKGWVLFASGPAARVELRLGEQPLGRARVAMPRPDIELLTDDPLAGVSGFELSVDLGELGIEPGEAELRAVATGTRGEGHELPPVTVSVGGAAQDGGGALPLPPAQTPRAAGGRGRRLLVCTHQLNLGGAQLYLLDLLRELVARGAAEPTVVSAIDGVVRSDLEALGIPVHISSLVPLDDPSSHVGRVEELTHWAADRDFEVALINTATALSFPGAEAAAQLGIPAVWTIHESFPPAVLWSNLDREVRRRAEQTLSEAALALFEAEATRRLFEPIVGESRCVVHPYGLDLKPIDAARAKLDPAAARREADIAANAEVVLCVGTIEPRKAQLPLAQAFGSIAEAHPRARLVFVGARDDQDSEALADFVETNRLGDRIELVPVTPDVHRWYAIADVFVCASDIESLPRTVLEAMAFETPVLATRVFGLPELIDDGETGWLCEPRDTIALAAALDRALSSPPEERRRIGRAARELVVQRHDLDLYGRAVAELLDQVAAGKAPKTTPRHATAG